MNHGLGRRFSMGSGPGERPRAQDPKENPVDPGAVTASDGYTRKWPDDFAVANRDFQVHELLVDARQAGAYVTVDINQGAKTYTVPAGAPDDIAPGVVIKEYTITPNADLADGDLKLVEGLRPISAPVPQSPTGTRRA